MKLNSPIAAAAVIVITAALAAAQFGSSAASNASSSSGGSSSAPQSPVSVSSIAELNQLIGNLKRASDSAQADLSHLRIERWKTDSNTKRQTQNDTESILRNLQNAMPAILGDLQNSPENLGLTFKTYRNLDALYDVMASVVESVGAFGGKDEFQALSGDLNAMDSSRHAFAERMDKLANLKENEIGQLRAALQSARAAVPPKKTVVDDTEPAAKKAAPKKKPVPKPGTVKPLGTAPGTTANPANPPQ